MKILNMKNKFRKLFLLSQSILLTSQVYGGSTHILDPEYEFENIKLSTETKKIEEQIKFYHLPVEDWPKLYNNLRVKSKQKDFNYLNRIAFNLRDFMIRMASSDNNILKILSEEYLNQNYEFSLKKQFENLNFKNSRFHLLKDKSGKSFRFLDNAIIDKNGSSTSSAKPPKTLVLHGAFEAPNIRVGGVGAVLADMINAENTHVSKKIEARILTPFYDIFKDTYSDAEFIGFIDHEVDYLNHKSSIYQVKHPNYKQYFLQPDPNFHINNLYDIGGNSKLYNYFSDESWLYYSSGLAHFAALFKGKHNLKNINVIQVNDWHLCFTPALLELRLNPLRQVVNLSSISTIATTHEHVDNNFTNGSLLYNRAGLPRPNNTDFINLQILFQLHSNISNAVSKGVADEMCDPQNGLNMGHVFKFLRSIDRFRGITNGVSSQNFDVTNNNVFKSLTVKNDLSDLNERKREAKQILFEEGIIGDPIKPLFLYVGRYSGEKGIDVLPSFADFVIANNSQMVTMGIVVDPHVNRYLEALENKNNPNIRVYKDLKKDQLEEIDLFKIRKGWLIRLASDYTIVPSKAEACGLVPVEAMAVGSCVITSYVQGLKDLCNPYNINLNNEQKSKTFDSLSFMRSPSIETTVSDLLKRTEEGLNMISTLKENDLLHLRQKWIQKSKTFDWSVPGGSIDQYIDLYSRAQETLSPAEKEKYKIFRNETGMNTGFEAENRFYSDWKSKPSSLDLSNLWPYYTL